MNEDLDFKKELEINKYRLDDECLGHSAKYAYYAEAQAEAKARLSELKDKLDFVSGEANLRIRKEYAERGEKVTEGIVASRLSTDSDVVKAKADVREGEEIYLRLTSAVNSMDVRRSELDNLVKLYVAGYFSTVKADGNVKKDIGEQTSMDLRKNLNR